MEDTITIMNFSGIYKQEQFYKNTKFRFLDCTHIRGTNCCCDSGALRQIREMIDGYLPNGIHFIDSGNYHYISKLWTDKLREPFSLVVFDHHPDMQPSLFDVFMSCGCWVKSVLDTNPYIEKVIIVGACKELLQKVEQKYHDKVIGYSGSMIKDEDNWKLFTNIHIGTPIYISVDKDVLLESEVVTNWDQGVLSLKQLKEILSIMLHTNEVVGIDICGECQYTLDCMNRIEKFQDIKQNDRVNQELLNLFCQSYGIKMTYF